MKPKINPDNLVIRHDFNQNCFYVETTADHTFIEYENIEPDMWLITEVSVSEALQNLGVAERMLDVMFEYCLEHEIQVNSSNTFVLTHIQQNPAFLPLLTNKQLA